MKNKYNFKGNILIIGGAEDKLNEMHILKKFFELSGEKKASILIVPIASDFPEVAANVYKTIFKKFGAKKIKIFNKYNPVEVRSQNLSKYFDGVTGIFISGGDQLRLSTVLGDSEFENLLKEKLRSGATIAGSSAGASALSSFMIVRGNPDLYASQDSLKLSAGLGVLENIIIDQHFTERKRLNRLITSVCYNPKNIGIGIDENTAIHIKKNGMLDVLGSGTVTIIDGSEITYNNISEVDEYQPFSVIGLKMHILSSSISFNLNTLQPLNHSVNSFQL
ncbi:MAG TPA: cyanophycinase [Ignavibacteria bacterium]|nr:cyanophycinase [Ignavibacteria bacterium]